MTTRAAGTGAPHTRRISWTSRVFIICTLTIFYIVCWFLARAYVDREVDEYESAQRVWVASEGMVNDTNRMIQRLPPNLRKQAEEETPIRPSVPKTANAYLKSPYRSPYVWVLLQDARKIRHERDETISTALWNLDHNTSQYNALNAEQYAEE